MGRTMREVAEQYVTRLEARDWDGWLDLLAEDVVYEIPQSRERVVGRRALLRFNQEYPGDWHLAVRRIVADEDAAVVWVSTVTDGVPADAVVLLDENDGRIAGVTDFWPETFEPPPGREHLVERW